MLATSATLLEAARSGSATPYVRVRLFDRDAGVPCLRFERWYEGAESDGPAAIVVAGDGSLLRARIDPGTDTLHIQRVEEPSAESAFGSWSSLATAVGCAVRADGEALAAWATGGVVYVASRPAAGSWGSPSAWSHSLATVNGLAVADAEDWALLVSGTDGDGAPGCWSTGYGSGVGGPPGHWSALRPVAGASPGLDVTYRATGLATAGVTRAALVESYAGTGAFDRAFLATGLAGGVFDDGEWREPAPFPHASEWGVAIASDGVDAYASAAGALWHAAASAPSTDVTEHVIAATYEAAPGGDRLALTLDARAADLAPVVTAGAEIAFAPGYVTDAGLEVAAGRALWVTAVTRTRRDGRDVVEVEALGGLAWLRRCRSARLHAWPAGERSVLASMREVARLAGFRVTVEDASDAATTLTPGFTVCPGEASAGALERLLDRLPDTVRARGTELVMHEADPDAEAAYTYGLAHPVTAVRALDVAATPLAARVLGTDVAGEAVAEPVSGGAVSGDSAIVTVVDAGLTTAGQAVDRAEAVLRRAHLGRPVLEVEAAPHPGQEPGDVVAVSDAVLGLDTARLRVQSVRFEFARRPRGRYVMRLALGEP
jgi:hypothetical protein